MFTWIISIIGALGIGGGIWFGAHIYKRNKFIKALHAAMLQKGYTDPFAQTWTNLNGAELYRQLQANNGKIVTAVTVDAKAHPDMKITPGNDGENIAEAVYKTL